MESWNTDTVLRKMQGREKSTHESLVMYVAEMGEKTCRTCREYHGKIFTEHDPEKPLIPVHPNCRCRYRKIQ